MKKIIILSVVSILFSANLWADTLIFKSGKTVDGDIKSITGNTVTMDISGVTEMTYDLSEIESINGKPIMAEDVESAPAQLKEPQSKIAIDHEQKFSQESQTVTAADTAAFLAIFLGIILAILLFFHVFFALCLQLIAIKTCTQPSWLAWIPVANLFLMCKIGGLSYFWLLALFVPFLNLVVTIYMWCRISEARGKPGILSLLLLVPIANLIFVVYLAFSGSKKGTVPSPVKGEEPASPYQNRPYNPPLE